jgi:long-chain acyl-CoA synthetase
MQTLRMQSLEHTGYASKEHPHLAQYDPEDVATVRRDDIEQTADAFMFSHHKGLLRNGYATRFLGAHTTYHQLDAQIDRVGRALMGYGVRQGDFVSILLPNTNEIVQYIYACWRIGAVACPMDPRTNSLGILARVKQTNSKLLITLMDICADKVHPILRELPVDRVVVTSPVDSLPVFSGLKPALANLIYAFKKHRFQKGMGKKYIWHKDFIRQYTYEGDIRAKYEPDMPAAVLYTSGTASDGAIKGAVHTHRALNAMYRAIFSTLKDWKRGDTFGGFIPFFSAYGLFCGLHTTLCPGVEIILTPAFRPEKFTQLVLREKPNIFMGVPCWFETLARSPQLKGRSRRLSFMKMPICGGDKISPASLEMINKAFIRNGCPISGLRGGYGATEFGGSISVMPRYEPFKDGFDWKKEGNVGFLLPNFEAMVIDPDTLEELPYGVDGELCVRGLSMMLEYYGLPKETEEITFIAKDGKKYYRMGDKGHLDERGCFYFVDRYKRSMMRPDGHTVHPSPIENTIMKHHAVSNCAVVGLKYPAATAGVIPSAFVMLEKAHQGLDEAQIRDLLLDIDSLCLKHLPERDRAIAYTVVDSLPYTLMNKINFRHLEKEPFDTARFVITDFAFFPDLRRKAG